MRNQRAECASPVNQAVSKEELAELFREMEVTRKKLLAICPEFEDVKPEGRHVNFAPNDIELPGTANPSAVGEETPKKRLNRLPPVVSESKTILQPIFDATTISELIENEVRKKMTILTPHASSEGSSPWALKVEKDSDLIDGANHPKSCSETRVGTDKDANDESQEKKSWIHNQGQRSPNQRPRPLGSPVSAPRDLHRKPSGSTHVSGGSHLRRSKSDERREIHSKIDQHTGQLFPTAMNGTARLPSHTRASSDKEGLFDDDDWAPVAENAYGAFAHVALQRGVWQAAHECGPMLLVSVLIQLCFAFELWRALPDIEDAPSFCDIPWNLQLSAVGVFLTLMLNNIPGIFSAAGVVLWSKEWRASGEDVELPVERGYAGRAMIFICCVLTEAVTFGGVCSAGVLFILTAESVDMLIRSTVAIIFVQNVDEIMFEACCARESKDDLSATRYKAVHPWTALHVQRSTWDTFTRIYCRRLHLPSILLLCCGVVFGLRASPAINCAVP